MVRLKIRTGSREELRDITGQVRAAVRDRAVRHGIVHLWSMHTTCALTVNEGADPDVVSDMVRFFRRLVPRNGDFQHAEGNSDSHIKVSLFGPGLTLLVDDGDLVLGTWQKVFLAEWDGPRQRTVAAIVQPLD
jgi:secondary thiamine-phosphate synthase enzyme